MTIISRKAPPRLTTESGKRRAASTVGGYVQSDIGSKAHHSSDSVRDSLFRKHIAVTITRAAMPSVFRLKRRSGPACSIGKVPDDEQFRPEDTTGRLKHYWNPTGSTPTRWNHIQVIRTGPGSSTAHAPTPHSTQTPLVSMGIPLAIHAAVFAASHSHSRACRASQTGCNSAARLSCKPL